MIRIRLIRKCIPQVKTLPPHAPFLCPYLSLLLLSRCHGPLQLCILLSQPVDLALQLQAARIGGRFPLLGIPLGLEGGG